MALKAYNQLEGTGETPLRYTATGPFTTLISVFDAPQIKRGIRYMMAPSFLSNALTGWGSLRKVLQGVQAG
jgi:hypothetical protein